MILEAFDPGARHYGWAKFRDRRLTEALLVVHDADEWRTWEEQVVTRESRRSAANELVIERMATYRGRAARGDANDLLAVEYTAGLIVGARAAREARRPTAATWKGQVPKPIHHARIQATLDLDEWSRLRNDLHELKNAEQSHVLDAVGLGLWALGRLKGGR